MGWFSNNKVLDSRVYVNYLKLKYINDTSEEIIKNITLSR